MAPQNKKSAENGENKGHPLMLDPIEQQRKNFLAWFQTSGQSLLSVATKAKVSESGLRSYKNGATSDMKLENKLKIAEAFGLKVEDIFGSISQAERTDQDPTPQANQQVHPTTVPVYGRVDRGQMFTTTNPIAYVEAPGGMTLSGNVFAIRMPNTSMMPRFRLREILLVDPDDAVDQGDDAVIIEKSGEIHILRCFENSRERGFTGGYYVESNTKKTLENDQIARIGRVVGILMGV